MCPWNDTIASADIQSNLFMKRPQTGINLLARLRGKNKYKEYAQLHRIFDNNVDLRLKNNMMTPAAGRLTKPTV